MTYEALAYQLQTQAYATVPFPLPRQRLVDVVEGSFFNFLRLQEELKHSLGWTLPIGYRGSEVGYFRRDPKNKKKDNKIAFHYNPRVHDLYAESGIRCAEFEELLSGMRSIYVVCEQVLFVTLQLFEETYPGITEAFFEPSKTLFGQRHFYVRFLAYLEGDAMLAKNHNDMSTCTLALAESESGLQIGWDEDHMEPVGHRDGGALFFPGITFPEQTSEDYPPSWHGVQAVKRPKYIGQNRQTQAKTEERVARWACVFFARSLFRDPPWEETHCPHPLAIERARLLDQGWRPDICSMQEYA